MLTHAIQDENDVSDADSLSATVLHDSDDLAQYLGRHQYLFQLVNQRDTYISQSRFEGLSNVIVYCPCYALDTASASKSSVMVVGELFNLSKPWTSSVSMRT